MVIIHVALLALWLTPTYMTVHTEGTLYFMRWDPRFPSQCSWGRTSFSMSDPLTLVFSGCQPLLALSSPSSERYASVLSLPGWCNGPQILVPTEAHSQTTQWSPRCVSHLHKTCDERTTLCHEALQIQSNMRNQSKTVAWATFTQSSGKQMF